MNVLSRLLEFSPYPELFARKLYYSFWRNSNKDDEKKKVNVISSEKKVVEKSVELSDLMNHLRKLGIKNGDILIVHTSTDGLKSVKSRENEILDSLIDLVGKDGTIALPAFPIEDKLKSENGIKIYDSKKSVAWTGMLPNLLLRKKGAIRSSFPYNPLVAYGKNANNMMIHNLETDLAHDQKSCWGYCVDHHAKILFLGLPSYHSCTVLHSVEDYNPDSWPNGWYEDKYYYIKTADGNVLKKVRVRKVEWAKYMAERYTENKYIKKGFIKESDYKDITIRYIDDCSFMIDEIWKNWKDLKFFYLPKRLLKR